ARGGADQRGKAKGLLQIRANGAEDGQGPAENVGIIDFEDMEHGELSPSLRMNARRYRRSLRGEGLDARRLSGGWADRQMGGPVHSWRRGNYSRFNTCGKHPR